MTGFDEAKWNLIESDPGVFTLLIKKLGAKGVEIEELWSLEDKSLIKNLKPIHGFIFLFKWVKDNEPAGPVIREDDPRMETIYFAKQVVPNACATFAILSLLMNCDHPDLKLGEKLATFKEFCMPLKPEMRGLSVVSNDAMREVHNSMESACFFEMKSDSDNPEDKSKDAFHFVAYVPINGRMYELDGLKPGPIDLGPIAPDQNWINVVRPVIQKRIENYKDGEIHFNLMAFVSDRKMILERRLNELLSLSERSEGCADYFESEISDLRTQLSYEESKMARYQTELMRRKHNYIPFLMELFKILAAKGQLMSVYECAKSRAAGAVKKAQAKPINA